MAGARKFTVAIDGPAAAGKGTIGRALSERFGFAHLDTGLLYRAVARNLLSSGLPLDAKHAAEAARSLHAKDTEGRGLRSQEVTRESSRIAAMPEVRAELIEFQRSFARQDGGAVLDGRDIATVIAPDAELKLFVTAEDHIRARRRMKELNGFGVAIDHEQVLAELRERDQRDRKRGLAALRQAAEAILLDTSSLTIAEAIDRAAEAVSDRLAPAR